MFEPAPAGAAARVSNRAPDTTANGKRVRIAARYPEADIRVEGLRLRSRSVPDRDHAVVEGRRVDQSELDLVRTLEQALALPQDDGIDEQRELIDKAFTQ